MSLEELQNEFNRVFKEIEQEQEQYWNSLSKEEQLKCFCAVARRIYEGEIEKHGSYRYVLYEVFGFNADAYAQAQMAGYLSIHNAIMTPDQEYNLLAAFCKQHNIENYQEKIQEYFM